MTVQHVYLLFDATTETYVAQFFSTHDKLMKRECENLYLNAKKYHQQNPLSPQGSLYRYADSFRMIHSADFDDQTGKYINLDIPVTICDFLDIQNNELKKPDIDIHADNVISLQHSS